MNTGATIAIAACMLVLGACVAAYLLEAGNESEFASTFPPPPNGGVYHTLTVSSENPTSEDYNCPYQSLVKWQKRLETEQFFINTGMETVAIELIWLKPDSQPTGNVTTIPSLGTNRDWIELDLPSPAMICFRPVDGPAMIAYSFQNNPNG